MSSSVPLLERGWSGDGDLRALRAVAAALLVLGIAFRRPLLSLLGLALAGVLASAELWRRKGFHRLAWRRVLSADRCFAGEEVQLQLSLSNDKPLPLSWLTISQDLPEELVARPLGAPQDAPRSPSPLRLRLALGPYARAEWRVTLRCPRRGHYRLGEAALETGDPFGFHRLRREAPAGQALVVYPRVCPPDALGLPEGDPFGLRAAARSLLTDPQRPMGLRDLRPEDPRSRIHWKATARAPGHHPLVKVEEPAQRAELWLALDVGGVGGPGPMLEDLERLVSVCAGLAERALGAGLAVGLVANGRVRFTGRRIRTPVAEGQRARRAVLEALAAVQPFPAQPFERLLAEAGRGLGWGGSLVALSAAPRPADLAVLARLATRHPVRLVTLAPGPAAPPGLRVDRLDAARIDAALWAGRGRAG